MSVIFFLKPPPPKHFRPMVCMHALHLHPLVQSFEEPPPRETDSISFALIISHKCSVWLRCPCVLNARDVSYGTHYITTQSNKHNTHARTHTHYPPCKLAFVRMETQTPFHLSLFNQMFQLPCQHIFIQALWVLLDIVSSVDFGQ